MFKTCSRCGEVKPLDEYYLSKGGRDGRNSYCKICMAEYSRRYREANREKEAERNRRWYEKNREKVAERHRRWREANQEKVAERHRRWREENREAILDRQRRYHEENREQIAEQMRRYRESNRDYINRHNARRMSRIQSVTSSTSTKCGRWSDAEIAILLADDGQSMTAKALELGRTYRSCTNKLEKLRRAGAAV